MSSSLVETRPDAITLLLDNDSVAAAVDMAEMVDVLEKGMLIEARGGVESVPRINLSAGDGFFRIMPVVIRELDVMGLKAFNKNEGNGVRYVIALWSVADGELLALLDASYLTAVRTGAVTGVAHRAMTAGRGFDEVGVLGSGLEAQTNLEGICAVCEIRRVKVFSPNLTRRERFANEMSERLGVEVVAVDTAEEAADADSVLAATNTGTGSGIVALRGEWLREASHVNTIGSTMPTLREVDVTTFGQADLVVLDSHHAIEESGDLQAAVSEAQWPDGDAVMSLAELLSGRRTSDGQPPRRTVFKSVGTALQDILAGKAIHETARTRGLGEEVQLLTEKVFRSAGQRR
jgi:alanine dehydrogenase